MTLMSFRRAWLRFPRLLLLACCLSHVATAAERASRPNIVLILTDDEDLQAHRFLPKTKVLLEKEGIAFNNYFVTYSFCCPSRATILRGQYAHNHRIQGNMQPTGGARKFRAIGYDHDTVAVWLQAAGYHTALYGKYLNDYEPEEGYVPPGWNEWYGAANDWFDYALNENGRAVTYGSRPEDYLTDVLARHATATIRRQAEAGRPFFLYIAPAAPHAPAIAAPRHEHLFKDESFPRPASFDEADVSDKPSLIRDLPLLADWQKEAIERHYRERLRSLQAVDDLVESVVETLAESGELDDTYVIYTSDNGWHMGEHRQFVGKTTAYEEDIHVPFVMRGPGVPKGARIEAMVLNNDLAPTFADMARVAPPSFVDGRSFMPLLEDPVHRWRTAFGLERRQRETYEIDGAAIFDGLRTQRYTYVRYATGEEELYDLHADPHQLQNIAATADPALLHELGERAAALANCAADECRTLEDLPLDRTRKTVSGPVSETSG
jgi:arylsulfatase A-like enzyme